MKLNLEDFKKKIGDKWFSYLEEFFSSEKAYEIYQTLKLQSKSEIITPDSKDTWKFLERIKPNSVKVIILAMDSYPGRYPNKVLHATGIPLDCSNSPDGKLQPSLIEFWNGIGNEYEEEITKTHDLQFLLDQGVFFGNRALTCKLFKTGSHMGMWDYFWEVFFQNFVSQKPDIPIVFLGKDAFHLKKYVSFNRMFELSHPSAAARSGVPWDTKGTFSNINKILKSLNGESNVILWDYKKYNQLLEETPF
jgi:uracil DNA glycosylase